VDIQHLKDKILEVISDHGDEIKDLGDKIMQAPELGFKEHASAKRVMDMADKYGLEYESGLGVTGVKIRLKGAKPGPTVALLGELDAVVVEGHPNAAPDTNAAHACGHNAQVAGIMGAMIGLHESGAMNELAGDVVIFAVPAEEYVEIGYRADLRKEGKITYLGGKPELVREGHFDDIDCVVMMHTASEPEDKTIAMSPSHNGFIAKLIKYKGRAAHAGGGPHLGINALNAAQIGLSAINALRETFKDEDSVRVHPIITKGGELVNVIPAEVTMETYLRAKTVEAIADADVKVDRALKAGALALGAKVEIETLPGFLPVKEDVNLQQVFRANAESLYGEEQCMERGHSAGSTDLGDISHIMPAIQPFIVGASGGGHSVDWCISDKDKAYVGPAKLMSLTVVDLLKDDAQKARQIIEQHEPAMSKEEYIAFLDGLFRSETFDGGAE
jgi:amidohydrolase